MSKYQQPNSKKFKKVVNVYIDLECPQGFPYYVVSCSAKYYYTAHIFMNAGDTMLSRLKKIQDVYKNLGYDVWFTCRQTVSKTVFTYKTDNPHLVVDHLRCMKEKGY